MQGVHRMLLHAWRLQFNHPISGVLINAEAPLDAQWHKALRWLQIVSPELGLNLADQQQKFVKD
jgi:tRNA pseudouridine65 synthase